MAEFLLETQTNELAPYLEERLFRHIQGGQVNKYECYPNACLISFNWYDIHNQNIKPPKVTICVTRGHIFFISGEQTCLSQIKDLIKDEQTVDRVLYVFFSELIESDIDYLEELEERITEIEDQVISDYKSFRREYSCEIISLRRELLKLKRYYESLNDIFEGLMENENGLIPKEDLRFFRILDSKIDRLFAHVLNLRDYVTQVREAYQAQIDIEQNNLMKIFTVITAIFLPLTLVVGWYGMNLNMPELKWPYVYPFVIVLSVVFVVVSVIFCKRRKWL